MWANSSRRLGTYCVSMHRESTTVNPHLVKQVLVWGGRSLGNLHPTYPVENPKTRSGDKTWDMKMTHVQNHSIWGWLYNRVKKGLKPTSCCTRSQTFPVAMTHLPQIANSPKEELCVLLLTALGYKDVPLCWDRVCASEAGQSHGGGCLCSLAPSFGSPAFAAISTPPQQCWNQQGDSTNAVGSWCAAFWSLLGCTPWIISSTAAEKMFQGVRKFPELELVKLMYWSKWTE